ncbi:DNA-binding protein [Rhodovulum euryhalinum]|uniref:DNA-binding protein n=1 Tax=Rhodovulum euryhalinum TaxID=35805 RepID=UPI001042FCE6|nr:DNA-binding protein [Rhodovulum euryhalinum]
MGAPLHALLPRVPSATQAMPRWASPPFVVIGRRVYYRIEAVREWLLAREQEASRKPSAPRAGRGR